MKRKIMSLVLSVVLILLSVLFLNNEKVVEAADNAVLLEKRHPGYWNYLAPDKMIEVQTIPGFEKVSTEEIKAGNVLKDFYQGNYSGVDITYKDGEMHFEGTATEDIWPNIANIDGLTTGTYFVSIGEEFPQNASLFIEAWGDNNYQVLKSLPGDQFFYLDSTSFNSYKFTVSIKAGTFADFDISPVLYKVSDDDRLSEARKYAIWKQVDMNQVTSEDWSLYERNKDQYSSYDGYSVIPISGYGTLKYKGGEENIYIDEYNHLNRVK